MSTTKKQPNGYVIVSDRTMDGDIQVYQGGETNVLPELLQGIPDGKNSDGRPLVPCGIVYRVAPKRRKVKGKK